MLHLATPVNQPTLPEFRRIVESATDPFWEQPRRYTDVSRGYESMDALRWGEGLNACCDCGSGIHTRFSCAAELRALRVCHGCWCKRQVERRVA